MTLTTYVAIKIPDAARWGIDAKSLLKQAIAAVIQADDNVFDREPALEEFSVEGAPEILCIVADDQGLPASVGISFEEDDPGDFQVTFESTWLWRSHSGLFGPAALHLQAVQSFGAWIYTTAPGSTVTWANDLSYFDEWQDVAECEGFTEALHIQDVVTAAVCDLKSKLATPGIIDVFDDRGDEAAP